MMKMNPSVRKQIIVRISVRLTKLGGVTSQLEEEGSKNLEDFVIQRNATFLEFRESGQGASESELDGWLPHPAEFGCMHGSDQTKKGLSGEEVRRKVIGRQKGRTQRRAEKMGTSWVYTEHQSSPKN